MMCEESKILDSLWAKALKERIKNNEEIELLNEDL